MKEHTCIHCLKVFKNPGELITLDSSLGLYVCPECDIIVIESRFNTPPNCS